MPTRARGGYWASALAIMQPVSDSTRTGGRTATGASAYARRAHAMCHVLFVPCLLAGAVQVQAQTLDTVTSRARPELDALGVRAGAFRVYPRVRLSQEWNDNVFAQRDASESDSITFLAPAVTARSDWNNHALNVDADAGIARYASNDAEDYEDYALSADGRIDVSREQELTAGVRREATHEARGSPDDARGFSPTPIDITTVFAGYEQRFNRVSFALRASSSRSDYEDVEGSSGVINNDDRDRTRHDLALTVDYTLAAGPRAFVRTRLNAREYESRTDDNGLERSSEGYELVLGVRLPPAGLYFGDLFLGYAAQDYDDPKLTTIEGVSGGANLSWLPTALTTVTATVFQDIRETVSPGASGVFATGLGLVVDHELLRNLLLQASLSTVDESYRGEAREDRYDALELGARYLMNRHFQLALRYRYDERESNTAAASEFKRTRASLALTVQL